MRDIVKIKVIGKNINRFLRKLINNKIDLIDIKYGKRNEVVLKVYEKDLDKIKEIKTIYRIIIVETYGKIKIKKQIKYYKYFILSCLIGFIVLILLVNIITKVEVVHTDKMVRNLLTRELEEYGVKKYRFKKSYDEINTIKDNILRHNKETIEWLEIERIGTKYIVKVEERKINKKIFNDSKVNVVAKKNAIIKKITAKSGVIVRDINSYVNSGDIIISGEVYLEDKLKDIIKADGKVYGEVWYKSSVDFPYLYNEINYTGKSKIVYCLAFLNWKIDFFNFHKFKDYESKDNVILKHLLLPFKLVREERREVKRINKVYKTSEAINEARKLGIKKINDKLSAYEKIIMTKDLNVAVKKSKIRLDMFITVYEDITDYKEIDVLKLKEELGKTN